MRVEGPTGSGKTSTALHVALNLRSMFDKIGEKLKVVYINTRLEAQTRYTFLKRFSEKISSSIFSRSLTADEIIVKIVDYAKSKDMNIFLVLDEVDYVLNKPRSEWIIYDVTRLSELTPFEKSPIIGVLLIARNCNWVKKLELAERSSVGHLVVRFNPYTLEQVVDILEYRASEAFQRGAVSRDVIEYIASITVHYANSDVRYALDVLYYSGILAESYGDTKITLEHVRQVISQISPHLTTGQLDSLSLAEKVTLLAIVTALKCESKSHVAFSRIKYYVKMITEQYGLSPLPEYRIEKALQKLHDMGIVDVAGITRIGISVASLERIEEALAREFAELCMHKSVTIS